MKRCNNCGALVQEEDKFCTHCGGGAFTAADVPQPMDPSQSEPSAYVPVYPGPEVAAEEETDKGHGNILAGVVGAFLFSIIGGALYFVVYQMGYIAGICGLVIFVLANFGYGLFAKNTNKASVVCLVVSILAMALMIFLAEYFCLSYEIYSVYESEGITFFDALRATPEFLTDSEVSSAVVEDLVFAYIFGFAASISNIISARKARKK